MTINNNNIFGLFTLNEARGSRLTGDWLHTDTIANYGWFGGGSLSTSPVTVSATVDRIDFSNDLASASPRGSLSLARYGLSATGNSNYGWFGGGYYPAPLLADPPYLSTVDRIDFSNDSSTVLVRSPLSLARVFLAATGNSNYGWFGGGTYYPYGDIATIPFTSSVDRIDFSNDSSTASPRGSLSLARKLLAATGNSNYGWFGGGFPGPGPLSTVDRIDFSNDLATASPRGSLSLARYGLAATGNSNYGWFGGGFGTSYTATVDRIDFSNDSSTASPRGPLSLARGSLAATGNSNYGWFGGGYTPSVSATVDRIDFSNDSSMASPRGSLSVARSTFGATSGVLNIRRQKAGNYGWWGGGYLYIFTPPGTTTTGIRNTVVRLDFSNDVVNTTTRGSLSIGRRGLFSVGNVDYGWFGGGRNSLTTQTPYSRVDRLNFSNDTSSTVKSPVSYNVNNAGSVSNANYGWFGGGAAISSPIYSSVGRIDFSSDSLLTLSRGSLNVAKYFLSAVGNNDYGWFGGGSINFSLPSIYSTVERIDFSNDLALGSQRGFLTDVISLHGATGNNDYGWFGGGYKPPSLLSRVDRINFKNDSVTAISRGPLSEFKSLPNATSNSNYGWFGGGFSSASTRSTIDRIDFSNDSVSASIRSYMNIVSYDAAAISNML